MSAEKRKGPSNSTQPVREHANTLDKSIAQNPENVKENLLKEWRTFENLSPKDIVKFVKSLCPGYDKMLQSKCENGKKYGITLRNDVFNALVSKFAPEQAKAIKRERNGRHNFDKYITCRLSDEDHERLLFFINRAGYATVQSWLSTIVKRYIAQEEQINGND